MFSLLLFLDTDINITTYFLYFSILSYKRTLWDTFVADSHKNYVLSLINIDTSHLWILQNIILMTNSIENKSYFSISARGWKSLAVACLITISICLRLGVVTKLSHELREDRDAYLTYARTLASGDGFRPTAQSAPSAFRPPLYPIALTFFMWIGAESFGVAFINIVCGGVTVWATWRIGKYLRLGNWSLLAALFVAIDPLLVRYASMPMTETFFTMLVSLLFLVTIRAGSRSSPSTRMTQFAIGLLFGLSALCRPTIWAFGGLVFLVWFCTRMIEWKANYYSFRGFMQAIPRWTLLGMMMIVSPWAIRNAIVLRSPVFMTTHGGYTLVMGNNPYFWNDVVKKPWGTTWSYEQLVHWQKSVDEAMQNDPHPPVGEAATGDWMTRRAITNIKANPTDFLHACWFRVRRFWNNQPQGNAAASVPYLLILGVKTYYMILFVMLLLGIYFLFRDQQWNWMPLLLMILSFTIVHAVFWSNARMRIPLVPAISLIATYGIMQLVAGCRKKLFGSTS